MIEAVAAVLRQPPLAPATELCPLVQERLNREALTPADIRTALQKVPCSVIRPVLPRQWEHGIFHPKEQMVLEQMGALLLETSPASPVANTLEHLGVTPTEPDEDQEVQQQQRETAPLLLHVRHPWPRCR